ncbi:hypothetical protein PILCRDRAFT_827987 [Piloderma croceum F 1598]|uniref:Shr3 amino acid permease chaperone n=1 Tax=Piloderma croceum (strain F 1598) TaxID=765440 RepID=A0A0C3BBH0_PILCF|nr:hypothetical protein PILCRDRAFT_827987 [Piloderma croceum F 1598]
MGFRGAAVLSATSFFIGIQFICFNVDYRILYRPLTDQVIDDGFQFYTTFFNAPPAIKALLHGFIGVGFIGLLTKLHAWDDSAMFFDGTSLVAYIFAFAVYMSVAIPSLRTIATPAEGNTRDDRIEAMRVLSAGNTIIIVILAGVLLLQAGEEYARRAEAKELAKIIEAEKKAASAPQGKKDQ